MNLRNATFELGAANRTSGGLLNRVTRTVPVVLMNGSYFCDGPADAKEADDLLAGLRADAQEQTEAGAERA